MSPPRLTLEQTVLLVVDLQEKLLPIIEGSERVVKQTARLIRGCAALGVPIIATEQYPQGLGPTVQPIRSLLLPGAGPVPGAPVVSKVKFSASVEDVRKWIAQTGRTTVLLAGIESHVCIMQTALDLTASGHVVAVATDAIGSSRRSDHETAMLRLVQAGVIPVTVEMALLEMVHEAGTSRFKAVLPVLKG